MKRLPLAPQRLLPGTYHHIGWGGQMSAIVTTPNTPTTPPDPQPPTPVLLLRETFPAGLVGAGRSDLEGAQTVQDGGPTWTWHMGQSLSGETLYPSEVFAADAAGGARQVDWFSTSDGDFGLLVATPSVHVCGADVEYVLESDVDIPANPGASSHVLFDLVLERRRSTPGVGGTDHSSWIWVRIEMHVVTAAPDVIHACAVTHGVWNADAQNWARYSNAAQPIPPGALHGAHTIRAEKRPDALRLYWDDTLVVALPSAPAGSDLGAGTADGFGSDTGGAFGFGWRDDYTAGTAYPLVRCTRFELTAYPDGIPT